MPRSQGIDLGLTAYAELFMDDASREEAKLPRIYDIPLSEIDDFPDHPFQVKLAFAVPPASRRWHWILHP